MLWHLSARPCRPQDRAGLPQHPCQGGVLGRAGRRGCLTARKDALAPPRASAGSIALGPAPRRDQDGPGAKTPGQRPPRRRRALASVLPGPAGLQGTGPRGRGNAGRVSCSRTEGRKRYHRFSGRGHRPCHSAAPGSGPAGGPKPPASARPAPGGRFSPAGSGAGLPMCRDLPVCRAPSRAGGGNAMRFLFPPTLTTAPSPPQWQGPSPLPQRCAGIRTSRGPKPPASARPAPGGRFAPAGSGAGLRPSRTCRSTGHRCAGAGETRVAFPIPARRGDSVITASLTGAIVPATAPHRDQDQSGTQSPRPAPGPPMAGAGLLLRLRERLLRVRDHAAGREVQRVS